MSEFMVDKIRDLAEASTNQLIESLIYEVRIHDGVDTRKPIPMELYVNVEARIKSHLAVSLGICSPGVILEMLQDKMADARERDAHRDRS